MYVKSTMCLVHNNVVSKCHMCGSTLTNDIYIVITSLKKKTRNQYGLVLYSYQHVFDMDISYMFNVESCVCCLENGQSEDYLSDMSTVKPV